jgi:hypothetical protein
MFPELLIQSPRQGTGGPWLGSRWRRDNQGHTQSWE